MPRPSAHPKLSEGRLDRQDDIIHSWRLAGILGPSSSWQATLRRFGNSNSKRESPSSIHLGTEPETTALRLGAQD